MRKKIISFTLCLLLVLVAFCSCGPTQQPSTEPGFPDSSGKLLITATVFPAYDFARAVCGDKAELKMLMKPGGEVHSYSPTADDMLVISQTDLFICIGGESDEDWVEDTIEAGGNTDVTLLKMSDCVNTLDEGEALEPEEEDDDDEIEEAETDEHVWTSPVNAQKIVNKICEALCEIDAENAEVYKANAASYNEKLSALDGELREISYLAQSKTLIFADRFPFLYFCKEYGYDYVAAFAGCSASADPSAQTIKTLVDKVKETGAKTVFTIEFSSEATADTVCEATGAAKTMLHSCHNVSQEDFDSGITYIDLMNQNIQTLREVFGLVAA